MHILKTKVQNQNVIVYKDVSYGLYGLKGAGYLWEAKEQYPVFSPVYLSEANYAILEDEQRILIYGASKFMESLRDVEEG